MTIKKYNCKEERIKTENNREFAVHKRKKEKSEGLQKRLNNGFLEVDAHTLYNIGREGTCVPKYGSRSDIPFVPSIKSLPCTSFSDATLLLKLKNYTLQKPLHKCSKKILNLEQTNKENIRKLSTNHLLDETNNSELPNENLTDVQNCISINSFHHNHVKTIREDNSYSTTITESIKSSQTITDTKETVSTIFPSQLSNSYLSHESGMEISTPKVKTSLKKILYSQYNNKIIEYNNITNQPSGNISQLKTKAISNINEKGNVKQDINETYKQSFHELCRISNTKKQTILALYDCNKYPLTDHQGKILKTAGGKSLVKYKNGKAYDCFGRDIFDARGNSFSSPIFKPFSNVCKNKKIISSIPLFDFRGYCLINYDGSSLRNADGKDLVKIDREGKLLYDINKHPIFDKNGIPVTKQKGLWILPNGIPVRVFDKAKHPLTTKHGEPLLDIKNEEILKCDQHGRPLHYFNDDPVFDAAGNSAAESKFNPSIQPSNNSITLIAMLENKPAQLFDKKGWPLTEKNGEVLNDSTGHCLLMLKKVFPNEITDFEQLLFRLNEPVPLTEICIYLPDTKITDQDGHINKQIETKELRKIVLDFVGHPLSDRFEGNIFDKNGRKIFLNIKSYFVGISNDPSSSTVRLSEDAFTIKTMNTKQMKIWKANRQVSSSADEVSYQTETDLFGRPLYDSLNRPLFDKYGRPLYDLFGRYIYDSNGKPIASAEAKRLDNGLHEPPGMKIGFKASCLIPQDPKNLPKITDLNGGPLFDSLGCPLYNQNGKPLIDAYGRSLYDENGFPQCDEEGRPVSKLVKQRHTPISSVEDKIEMLQLYPIDSQTKKLSVNDEKTTQFETLYETAKSHKSEEFKTSKIMKNFIARIRVTTFSDGEKYFEILESVPFS